MTLIKLKLVLNLNRSMGGWLRRLTPLQSLDLDGNVNSVEWNDGMERWNGLLEWITGLDYWPWSATPTNSLHTWACA